MSDGLIKYETNSVDCVSAETEGTYTKLKGKGAFQSDKRVIRQERTDVRIEASVSVGMCSLHDRKRDIAIAVPIEDMSRVLNEALRIGVSKEWRSEN